MPLHTHCRPPYSKVSCFSQPGVYSCAKALIGAEGNISMKMVSSFLLPAASPFPRVLTIFLVSLMIVMGAGAWFTRRLEALCDRLDLSAGMLSILGALGANIPNYVSSIVAIASGQQNIGLGIIIGSNIYNL